MNLKEHLQSVGATHIKVDGDDWNFFSVSFELEGKHFSFESGVCSNLCAAPIVFKVDHKFVEYED